VKPDLPMNFAICFGATFFDPCYWPKPSCWKQCNFALPTYDLSSFYV